MELAPGASEREIKNAYHLMVKVWHPDRFQNDPTLGQAAEIKLKEINAAYLLLTAKRSSTEPSRRPSSYSTVPPDSAPRANPSPPRSSPPSAAVRVSSAWVFPAILILFRVILVAVAALAARYLWIAFDIQGSTSEAASKVYGFGKDTVFDRLDEPKRRFMEAVRQDLRRIGVKDPQPPPALELPQAIPSEGAEKEPPSPHIAHREDRRAASPIKTTSKAPVTRVASLITVGSTRDEILDQLGPPATSTPDKLVYGQSELYLKDNSVVGWHIDPFTSPIRVKLWPSGSVDPTLTSFTIGSSQDVVLVVQGTPTSFSQDKFEYAGSEVYFQNRRVVRWKSDPATIPLRARLP